MHSILVMCSKYCTSSFHWSISFCAQSCRGAGAQSAILVTSFWIKIRLFFFFCSFVLFVFCFFLNFLCVLKCNDVHYFQLVLSFIVAFFEKQNLKCKKCKSKCDCVTFYLSVSTWFERCSRNRILFSIKLPWYSWYSSQSSAVYLEEKGLHFDLPSCEVAFRCSRRSQPNTFSLLPPFLRTLLILPFCKWDQTGLDDDDSNSAQGISKVLCSRCFCLVCYRTWCCRRHVSGSFAALESLDHSRWLATRCITLFIFSSAKLTKFDTAQNQWTPTPKAKLSLTQKDGERRMLCSPLPHDVLSLFSLSKPEAPPMLLHFSYLLKQ